MKTYKIKTIIIFLIIITCSIGAYFSSPTSQYKKKVQKINTKEKYEVIKVLDGDTFQIKIKKEIVTIRMLGIDTPETVDPRKIVQCFGKQASEKTKELLLNHKITLVTDSSQNITDKFNRILAYVYRDDGLLVNRYLIEKGYAYEYTYNIPYQKQEEFRKLEKYAKISKLGLWGDICQKK